MFSSVIQTTNQEVYLPILEEKKVQLFIKREDCIHPSVSGNKFRKLKYNILEAMRLGKSTLLTFGGAYSNHIAATAFAGNMAGFKTVGVIRGEELGNDLNKTFSKNATLEQASKNGMNFHFIDRETYRNKTSEGVIKKLLRQFGDFYLIPEGGTNELAIQGCEEILTKIDKEFNHVCVAVGSGGTISGLINAAFGHQKILGFPALRGEYLEHEISSFVGQKTNWNLIHSYHFGGYAKSNVELIRFINSFFKKTTIPLDPIYTGKMIYGILDLIKNDYFHPGSKIIAIHTGGLQGIEGYNKMQLRKKGELIHVG